MKTELSLRIEALLQKKNGGNQSEMARFVGVSPQAVQQWISGETSPRGRNLKKVAEFFCIEPGELQYGERFGDFSSYVSEGESSFAFINAENRAIGNRKTPNGIVSIHPDDELPEGIIQIMEYRVSFSAGNGRNPNYELIEEAEPATYRMSWFQKNHMNPNRVKRFKISGDSMAPLLSNGDTVLVNLEENDLSRILEGRVYAIRYGDELRVKRLYRRLDGTLTLRSDNADYKDEDVSPGLAQEHISIIGRVREKSGPGGL